jgi:hypothetical protein
MTDFSFSISQVYPKYQQTIRTADFNQNGEIDSTEECLAAAKFVTKDITNWQFKSNDEQYVEAYLRAVVLRDSTGFETIKPIISTFDEYDVNFLLDNLLYSISDKKDITKDTIDIIKSIITETKLDRNEIFRQLNALEENDLLFGPGSIRVSYKHREIALSLAKDIEPTLFQYQQLGIEKLERFSRLWSLQSIIDYRTYPLNSDRPVALLVYAKKDNQAAFFARKLATCSIDELLYAGYQVCYYEVSDEASLREAFISTGIRQKIDLVVIAGHGQPKTIALSKNVLSGPGVLDPGDGKFLTGLVDYCTENCEIVLESCLTGYGIADFIAEHFSGHKVHAPLGSPDSDDVCYKFSPKDETGQRKFLGIDFGKSVRTYTTIK